SPGPTRRSLCAFFFQAEDGIRDFHVTGVQTCALPIWECHQEEHPGPLPLIISIVISNTPGGWKGPLSFHDLCDPHPSAFPGVAEIGRASCRERGQISVDARRRERSRQPAPARWSGTAT